MSDPEDFEFMEPNPAAKAFIYGMLIAWAVLVIGGISWVLWGFLQ